MPDVVKNFKRPGAALLKKFSVMQPATLHEVMGKRGALSPDIRPVWPEPFLCGSALTVKARPGDNLMLHKAVSIAQPGDILMVSVDGFLEAGIWGEIIAVAAMEKGIAGIVTDGSVRDTIPIKALGFPMYSRGICMNGTTKMTPGEIGRPLVLGNVLINPGDIVVGDHDGVVVVPLDQCEEILAAAKAKEDAEAEIIRKIKAGGSTRDILGFKAVFERLGLKEE
jgi:4-hydroxy-4-methyl-2-oxoglutarate aldolase